LANDYNMQTKERGRNIKLNTTTACGKEINNVSSVTD